MITDERIDLVALAIRECVDGFRDPAHYYIENETRSRWLEADPGNSETGDIRSHEEWALESYRIIARAVLKSIDAGPALVSLDEHNKRRRQAHLAQRSADKPNGILCPDCSGQMVDDHSGAQYLTHPPRIAVNCPSCGFRSTRVV